MRQMTLDEKITIKGELKRFGLSLPNLNIETALHFLHKYLGTRALGRVFPNRFKFPSQRHDKRSRQITINGKYFTPVLCNGKYIIPDKPDNDYPILFPY